MWHNLFGVTVVIVTIVGVSIGRYPVLRMNRATIAFVGAVLLLFLGVISLEQAYAAIDLNTIVLLLSIMILNANFRISGFFTLITGFIVKISSTPKRLLALIIFASGGLSALFLNDTIVLVFTPLVLEIMRRLNRNPVPYLIALATAANVGSAGTIIGNPQNIIIGSFSKISFVEFARYLLPVAVAGLFVIWIVIMLFYRREFASNNFGHIQMPKQRLFKPLLRKSLISSFFMLVMMIVGLPVSMAALGAAAILLVTRRLKPERVFAEIDWSLLVFFSALFVVTHSLETMGMSHGLVAALSIDSGYPLLDLSVISTLASNLISNVPAVLLLRPVVESFSNQTIAWLTLAMATTFAGNLTLLGSVANLIVAESAKKEGVVLSFGEYLKCGLPITLITIIMGIIWLSLFY